MDMSQGRWPTVADERYQAGAERPPAAWLDLSSSEAANVSEDGFDEGSSESDGSDWASDAVDDEPYEEIDDEGSRLRERSSRQDGHDVFRRLN
jgi:hypothetical protein